MGKQPQKRSAAPKSNPRRTDAVQMLKADHQQVKSLFTRFRTAPAEEQALIAKQLFTELEIHTTLEEELFYPALRSTLRQTEDLDGEPHANGLDTAEADEGENALNEASLNGMDLDLEEESDEELVMVAYEEHQAVKELIEQLKTLDAKSADFRDVFAELEEAVLDHVTGEEDLILPMALSELDTQALGGKMQQRRDELVSRAA